MKSVLLSILNDFKDAINFFMKLFSAFLCACLLLLITLEYMKIVASAPGWEKWIIALPRPNTSPEFIGGVIGDLVFLPPTVYLGVAFGRFLLRAAPPVISGRVRGGALLLSVAPILACAFFSGLVLLLIITFNQSVPASKRMTVGDAVFWSLFLLWAAACAFTVLMRHLKPMSFLDRPFVLFLRRFSKFPDRAVVSLILRQTPPDKPVAFFVPADSRAEDWNPFLVGFAGMKLLHPFRSVPVVVKSDGPEWERAVKLLVDRAQIIILDISETSDAIETEYEIISESACWRKMIFLKNDSAETGFEFYQNIRPSDSRIIRYRESWVRGLPRMLLGACVIIYVVSPVLTNLFSAIPLIEYPLVNMFSTLLVMLAIVWIHFLFFGHSSIDRASKASLRKMLRADGKRT